MTLTDKEQGLRRRAGSDFLIGRYSRNENGQYCITDVRGEKGNVLDFENQSEVEILYENDKLQQGAFYRFKWGLDDEDHIIIEDTPKQVDHKKFLQGLYNSRISLEGEYLKTYNDFQATILNEVTGAQHTYLYELLQNANDYPYKNEKVKVKFVLTDHYLFFLHTGAPFNLRNIVGICSINQGEKRKNTQTIGYKGIGFKSVFVRNNVVYLKSDDWQLRFDEEFANRLYYGQSPWALIPIPTDDKELDEEVFNVFNNAQDSLRVKFALRHRENASQHIPQLDKVFSDSQILLFIPNVDEVEVIVKNKLRHHITKDEEKWVVTDYDDYKVPESLREWVAANINSGDKIPEKFKDIENIRISFAISREGNSLLPVPDARVYNYLPTELKLGFSFLFNADFVPNGSRNGLHDVKWNDHVMTQCGRYFTRWWTSFMKEEGAYNLQSVFNILPSFDSRDHYAGLFEKGAWQEIENIACIPTLKGGYHLCKLKDIIYDTIGITSTTNPIMSDEEFYSIVGGEQCLPHPAIRESEQLIGLLTMVKGGCHFGSSHLTNLAFNKSFLSWIEDKENYLRFFRFIVDTDYISNFLNYPIFRRWDGTITAAKELYYDIDEYLEDIAFLSIDLSYLDVDVRQILEHSQRQKDIQGKFKKFSPEVFATEVIENTDSDMSIFSSLDNSTKFVHFLATINYSHELPQTYPFFTTNNKVVTDRSSLYQYSEEGAKLRSQKWINDDWILFINPAYTEKDGESVSSYIEKRQGVAVLTAKVGYERIISNNTFIPTIADYIKEEEANIDFFLYVFYIQNCGIPASFSDKMRENYSVLTHDASNNTYWTPLRQTIFWDNDEWRDVASASWMIDGLCVAINNSYLKSVSEKEKDAFKKFLNIKQITQEFSINGLYNPALKNRAKDILSGITTTEQSYDFLQFLYDNRKNLKELHKTFAEIPIKCKGKDKLVRLTESKEENIYIANADMVELCAQPWLDISALRIANERYNDLFDNKEAKPFFAQFGLKVITKKDYVINEILPFIDKIRPSLEERASNISFHRFFISLSAELSDNELNIIKDAPIYLSSNTLEEGVLAEKSTDHYLPSQSLIEATSLDIVPAEIMDSIHKDYIKSQDDQKYFVEKLGNVMIDTAGFVNYIFSCADNVRPYLRDKERNIRFWRWLVPLSAYVRDIEDKEARNAIQQFPIIVKGAEDSNTPFSDIASLYISDVYAKVTCTK